MVNIFIVDNEVLFVDLLEMQLCTLANIKIAGKAYNYIDVLMSNEALNADILLLGIPADGKSGITVLESILNKNPYLHVLILSASQKSKIIQKSLNLGAMGFCSKAISIDELSYAIKTIGDGGSYVCKSSLNAITNKEKDRNNEFSSFGQKLTHREKDVLSLIYNGYSNKEIADELFLSVKTVETHRRNMLQKYGEKNFIGLLKTLSQSNEKGSNDMNFGLGK